MRDRRSNTTGARISRRAGRPGSRGRASVLRTRLELGLSGSRMGNRALCLPTWVGARRALRRRCILDEEQVKARRRSDTVFVFGSGSSLNILSPDDWARIAEHDTFGFNWFVRQDFVRCDFHLIRQIADANDHVVWKPQIDDYCRLLDSNPRFADTVLLVQHEWGARGANLALSRGIFPRRSAVFPWHTNRRDTLSRSFRNGLVHGSSTLLDTVNAAYLLGWRDIVLAGVDLYDRRYFWLPEGETRPVDVARDKTFADAHTQAGTALAATLAAWQTILTPVGVRLWVFNPRSLLAGTLPVFRLDSR